MASNGTVARKKVPSNLYTAILGISLGALLLSLGYVAYQCWTQYGTLLPPIP